MLADNTTAALPLGMNNTGETHTSGVTKTHMWNRGIPLGPRTRLEYRECSLDRLIGSKSSGTAWNRAGAV